MGVPVFYLENPEHVQHLSTDDSYHAHKVLRMKAGDPIFILNGNGKKYQAILKDSDAKKTNFTSLSVVLEEVENKNHLNLWIAPTKQMERMEWMIEKCTEIGIRSFGFFISKNSERKEIKLPRLEKIIISAIKQSKQLYIPKLHSIQPFEKIVLELSKSGQKNAFAYISEDQTSNLQAFASSKEICNVLIGPEGDFNSKEVEFLFSKDFKSFSLGNSILRTETAGLFTTVAFSLNN